MEQGVANKAFRCTVKQQHTVRLIKKLVLQTVLLRVIKVTDVARKTVPRL